MAGLVACGPSQSVVSEQFAAADEVTTDDQELSTARYSYVTFKRDLRKCISPLCGGFWVTPVNKPTAAPTYVSGLDFSVSKLDDAVVAKLYDGAAGEVVLKGRLGPTEPRFNTRPLMVQAAWRGLPGATIAAGSWTYIVDSHDIRCFTWPCPTLDARRIGSYSHTMFSNVVIGVEVSRLNNAWLADRVKNHGALVAGTFVDGAKGPAGTEKNLKAEQVFLKIDDMTGPCPVFKLAACPSGQVRAYSQDENLCQMPGACVKHGICPLYALMRCADGYSMQSWTTAPSGCFASACSPSFVVDAE